MKIRLGFLPTAAAAGGLPAAALVSELATGAWVLWILVFTGLSLGFISLDFVVGLLAIWLDAFLGPKGLVLDLVVKAVFYYLVVVRFMNTNKVFKSFRTWLTWTIIGVV
ncbi:MAG: hypothetical protein HXY34_08580 [Candidatus Thorarchaeota archaeon]|nr:hypothetical protein [Candidatus Thorarchaeota archaeon]